MSSVIETVSELERRLDLSITLADIEKASDARIKDLAKTVKMAGFRPGKVPLRMVAQSYGPQVRTEAMQDALQKAFTDAVIDKPFRIAGYPRIEPKQQVAGSTSNEGLLSFTANFEVYPDIKLPEASALTIERPVVAVSDDDVGRTLDTLRKQRVSYSTADRAAAGGDRVMIDFVGRIDGVEFAGGSSKNFPMIVGEGRMLPEFEKACDGVKKGDNKTFNLTFPADYQGAEVAGKTAQFTIDVHEVAAPILPEINSEFAKNFGVPDGDVDKLKAEIRQNLELECKRRVFTATREQVFKSLRTACPITVPNSLVNDEAINMANRARQDLIERGMKEADAQVSPSTFETSARERVTLGLIVGEAVRQNGLQAKPDQVRAMLQETASTYEKPEQVVSWYYQDPRRLAEFEALTVENNVVDWALKSAKVTDRAMGFQELVGALGG